MSCLRSQNKSLETAGAKLSGTGEITCGRQNKILTEKEKVRRDLHGPGTLDEENHIITAKLPLFYWNMTPLQM